MYIGLIRHFKVIHPIPKKFLLTKKELIYWFYEYDHASTLAYHKIDLEDCNWERTFTSPLFRAKATARHMFNGTIVEIKCLQEVNILSLLPDISLPIFLWALIIQLKIRFDQIHTIKQRTDIANFIESIINQNKNTLIVCHWFVIKEIEKQLSKQGYQGKLAKSNEYGILRTFRSTN